MDLLRLRASERFRAHVRPYRSIGGLRNRACSVGDAYGDILVFAVFSRACVFRLDVCVGSNRYARTCILSAATTVVLLCDGEFESMFVAEGRATQDEAPPSRNDSTRE